MEQDQEALLHELLNGNGSNSASSVPPTSRPAPKGLGVGLGGRGAGLASRPQSRPILAPEDAAELAELAAYSASHGVPIPIASALAPSVASSSSRPQASQAHTQQPNPSSLKPVGSPFFTSGGSSSSKPGSSSSKPGGSSMQNLMQRTEAALAKQSNYKGQRDTSADQPPAGGGMGPGMGFPGLGSPGAEDSFMQAMMGMLGGGGGGALPDFGQLMSGGEPTEMMLSLILNKTALYEPMKELALRYPEWLSTHQDTVTPDELARYTAQLVSIHRVCKHFEEDSKDFKLLMQLMQEMQALGDPPPDIIASMSGGALNGQGEAMSHELQQLMQSDLGMDPEGDMDDLPDIDEKAAKELQEKCLMQ
ncbi:MAG: hypothetical protein WDW38_001018 [Sanguina aurantia]